MNSTSTYSARFVPLLTVAAIFALAVAATANAAIENAPFRQIAPEVYAGPGIKPDEIEELRQALESFRKQEFEQCSRSLEAACKKYTQLPPAKLMLARFFLADNLFAPGMVAMEQAAAEHPEYPGVYVTFGEMAIRQHRMSDALLHFEKVLAIAEDGPWRLTQRMSFVVRAHRGLASVAESRGDWASAKIHLDLLLKYEAKNGRLRQALARTLLHLDRPGEAYERLQEATKLDPTLAPPAVAMGMLYSRIGTGDKAAEWMDRAVKENPKDPKSLLGVATWLLQQGKLDDAQRRADAALKVAPDSAQAMFLCGVVAQHRKDYPLAETHFQLLHQKTPDDWRVRDLLAIVLAEQPEASKQRRAVFLAEANLKEQPDSINFLTTAGWAYYQLDRLDDAEKSLQAAKDKTNGPPGLDTAYYLARVRADRGQWAEVRDLLKPTLSATAVWNFREEARGLLAKAERSLGDAARTPKED
ncbi:MAG: tetratricopeptide repeat protein [Candidatus Nealsonbacteria bacterium]|nr:tetratricopeptide repeat protein [Candidatus Nealsonbacteria bacterium]